MMTPALLRAYRHFRKTPGSRANCCLAMARDEVRAADLGIEFMWEGDDLSLEDLWDELPPCCKRAEREGNRRHGHSIMVCIAKGPDGHTLAALGGIVDPTSDDARYTEAELAGEAIDTLADEVARSLSERPCPSCNGSGRIPADWNSLEGKGI